MSNVVKDLFTFVAATLTYYRFFALFVRIWQKQSLPFCCYCLLHSVWTYLKPSHFVWYSKIQLFNPFIFWKSEKIVKIEKRLHLTIHCKCILDNFETLWHSAFIKIFSRVALECCSRCTHKSRVSKEKLKNAQNLITQWHCCLLLRMTQKQ